MKLITKKEAEDLALDASEISSYGPWNSTGYHTLVEDGKREAYVDVFKHTDDGRDYFAIGVTYDDRCEFSYTNTDNVEELTNLILELAGDIAEQFKEVSA